MTPSLMMHQKCAPLLTRLPVCKPESNTSTQEQQGQRALETLALQRETSGVHKNLCARVDSITHQICLDQHNAEVHKDLP